MPFPAPVPAPATPADLAAVLRLLTASASRPRVTWYAPGERIELSGAVLDNWVTKIANLLVEEFDAGPGTRVALDLPAHWRTITWAFGVWRVGAAVVIDPADADVVVTTRPLAAGGVGASGPEVIALTLAGLARRFDGDLPPGAMDGTQAVMTYPDQLAMPVRPDPHALALGAGGAGGAGGEVRHDELVPRAAAALASRLRPEPDAGTDSPRILLPVCAPEDTDHPARDAIDALEIALGAFAADGSVVLAAGLDDTTFANLHTTERITATCPPRP